MKRKYYFISLLILFVTKQTNLLECVYCRKLKSKEFATDCIILMDKMYASHCYINLTGCYVALGDGKFKKECVLEDSLVVCTSTTEKPNLHCGDENELAVYYSKGSLKAEPAILLHDVAVFLLFYFKKLTLINE